MSYCLNPHCQHPRNPPKTRVCQNCGSALLLKERYRILKPIARGGFGRTFLALDEDRLNAPCVVKQLLPRVQGTEASKQAALVKAIALFNQEAVMLYQLGEHPQIPTLLASFEQDKLLYLVQQYIDGKTLWHELTENGAFSETGIRAVLSSVLSILEFVHSKGSIHRDITPVNILRRKGDSHLILIDFGVAKQLSESSLTKTGTKVGTTSYAPIEQLRSGKAYPASDLYGLGVTCIHLLTGAKPDGLFDPLKGCIWREYLSARGRTIEPGLADILDKMIQDRVCDRYQSAAEVLADLVTLPSAKPSADRQFPPKQSQPIAPIPQPTAQQQRSERLLFPPGVTPPPATPAKPPRSSNRSTLSPASGPCMGTLTGHTSWITTLAISPNGQILISGSLDDRILMWNFLTGDRLRTLSRHTKSVNCLAISPDGTLFASCSDDDTIELWELNSGTPLATLTEHLRDVNAVAFADRGRILASGSEDRTVKLWQLGDRQNGKLQVSLLRTLSGRSGMIKAIAIGPSDSILASGGLDNAIHIWHLQQNKVLYTLSGHFQSVTSVAIAPDGKILASGSKDKTIKLWNLPTGSLMATLSSHLDMVNAVAFSPDGKTLASASQDTTIKLWAMDNRKGNAIGSLLTTFTGHTGAVNAIAFTPDGKLLVSGSWDKTIKIWRVS